MAFQLINKHLSNYLRILFVEKLLIGVQKLNQVTKVGELVLVVLFLVLEYQAGTRSIRQVILYACGYEMEMDCEENVLFHLILRICVVNLLIGVLNLSQITK
eukprot:TRINITY_DN1928_c0_g1_i4.p2 TRINITY_DN1928_c0_g1~~TRINITY_DN1928_c0_g1_i4.p2  ORF type:complete len:102 (-),score=0.09 TRINITY_DN1928_c0_g1_i4:150-455(-)